MTACSSGSQCDSWACDTKRNQCVDFGALMNLEIVKKWFTPDNIKKYDHNPNQLCQDAVRASCDDHSTWACTSDKWHAHQSFFGSLQCRNTINDKSEGKVGYVDIPYK